MSDGNGVSARETTALTLTAVAGRYLQFPYSASSNVGLWSRTKKVDLKADTSAGTGSVLAPRRVMNTRAIVVIGATLALTVTVQLDGQEKTSRPITISGCLQRSDARRGRSATTTIGTSGTEQFVLVKMDPAISTSHGSNDASTEASGSKKSAADEAWFLVTGDVTELRADIDRRVEITGTVATTGSVVGTSASVADGPSGTIHATAVKVVGASCVEKLPTD